MTGKFLVDANLPVALAAQLAGSGVDCVHVADRAVNPAIKIANIVAHLLLAVLSH
jgi:predicted nuclease of predicted toxin-antitoxin system